MRLYRHYVLKAVLLELLYDDRPCRVAHEGLTKRTERDDFVGHVSFLLNLRAARRRMTPRRQHSQCKASLLHEGSQSLRMGWLGERWSAFKDGVGPGRVTLVATVSAIAAGLVHIANVVHEPEL